MLHRYLDTLPVHSLLVCEILFQNAPQRTSVPALSHCFSTTAFSAVCFVDVCVAMSVFSFR